MSKIFLRIVMFIVVSIFSFAAEQGIGLIVNEKYGKVLEEKIRTEIVEEFKNSQHNVEIKSVKYVKTNEIGDTVNEFNKNSEINTIFILDYNANLFKIDSKKLIVYPFGMEGIKGKNTSKNITIQGVLDLDKDLKELKKLRVVNKVTYFMSQDRINNQLEFVNSIRKISDKNGITPEILSLTTDKETMKSKISSSDAVYVIANGDGKEVLQMAQEMDKLSYLVDFSEIGKESSLISYELKDDVNKRIRASVFAYHNKLSEKNEDSVTELGKLSNKRYYNVQVAKVQKVLPPKGFASSYKIIGEVKRESPKLELEKAIKYGLDNNQKLRSIFNRAASSDYNYMSNFAKRLPQATIESDYSYLEQNAVSQYTQDESVVTGGIKISQVLLNHELNAEIFSKKIEYLNAQLKLKEESDLLIQEVIDSYLKVLESQSKVNIAQSNYNMLEEFLKISKIKFETGSVGIQDVYRFEAELATAESELLKEKTLFDNSKYNLNKVLNLKPETQHSFETLQELSKKLNTEIIPVDEMSYNAVIREKVTSYFVQGALKNSNNIKIAENKVLDIDSQYTSVKRSRYIPEIEAFARYNKNNVGSSGKQSTSTSDADTDDYWTAGVGAKLPIFTSGERHFKQKSLNAEKEAVINEKNSVQEDLEKTMNTEISKMVGSYGIFVATDRTRESSKKYLDIIMNQYKIGSIGITDLLEAKNTYVQSEMSNLVANSTYFSSLIAVEKTYGDYIFMKDEKEKEKIKKEIQSVVRN